MNKDFERALSAVDSKYGEGSTFVITLPLFTKKDRA